MPLALWLPTGEFFIFLFLLHPDNAATTCLRSTDGGTQAQARQHNQYLSHDKFCPRCHYQAESRRAVSPSMRLAMSKISSRRVTLTAVLCGTGILSQSLTCSMKLTRNIIRKYPSTGTRLTSTRLVSYSRCVVFRDNRQAPVNALCNTYIYSSNTLCSTRLFRLQQFLLLSAL